MRGEWRSGGALTSVTPGELGGFGYVGAQGPNGLLVRSRAHGDVETYENSAAYGPQAGLILIVAWRCPAASFAGATARRIKLELAPELRNEFNCGISNRSKLEIC
jgi:hypothetical protein